MATTPTKLTFLNKAAVFGSGAFGTALSMVLAKKCKSVKVWHMKQNEADLINQHRENVLFLKTVRLPQHVQFTADVEDTYMDADIIVFVIPTQFLRGFLAQHKDVLCEYLAANPNVPVLVCSKGIEQATLKFPAQILHEFLPTAKLSVLAGPSFAIEVANGKLTNVCVASEKIEEARHVARIMTTPDLLFRCWSSTDTIGCEVSSAMKNVLAIASGVNSGLGNGYNARASLIARGVLELRDLTLALGGNGEAIFGLAGLGDLLLTCSSELSRNFSVGEKLGKGMSLDAIQRESHAVAEGVATSEALHRLADRLGVKLRICSEVYKVLYKKEDARLAFDRINSGRLMDEGLPPLAKMIDMGSKL